MDTLRAVSRVYSAWRPMTRPPQGHLMALSFAASLTVTWSRPQSAGSTRLQWEAQGNTGRESCSWEGGTRSRDAAGAAWPGLPGWAEVLLKRPGGSCRQQAGHEPAVYPGSREGRRRNWNCEVQGGEINSLCTKWLSTSRRWRASLIVKTRANDYHYTELKIYIMLDTWLFVERGRKVLNFFHCIMIGTLTFKSEGILVIWKESILEQH